ncbi:PREDICTED: probable disease resistance protein At5g47260, partial [Camelina sativa]|uniref:Probable disease resistance protein At5g47260 n=1 Tax=Camelina sativa TaxID=90675 RepID=A0ABM0T846_CAMSA
MMASPSSCTSRRDNEAHMTEKIAKDVSDKLKATSSRDFYVMDMVVPEMQSALDLDKKEALEKSLEALEMGLQALNAMRNNLLQRVYKEEGRGLPVLSEVKKWISDVEEIESKANPLLDKSISELHKLSKSEDGSQISEPTPNHYSEMVHQRLKEVETLKTKEFSEFVVDRAHLLHVRKILPLQPTLDKITLETKRLSPEESWDLFQEVVGEATLTSHPDIRQLARIVAKKCGGFCFALYLIGVTMSSKRTTREWYHAIHVLVSSAAEFSDMKDKILPILKFSYDSLPCENIRLCFLYCALFPEGDVTSKQGLVDCLIGEGIIADEEDREIAEIKGYEVIETLVKMFLLMEDESGYGVKMHDVVREMALWIASDFGKQKEHFVVVGGERIHQMPEVNDWRMVRRMSVTSTQIQNISESPDHSKLTTLFLKENNNLKCISGDFFRWMKSLLLLDLSNNKELADLPEEVSCLVSLQFLNLSFTSITRLPLGLKELKKLIHLDLEHTSKLKEIEVIAGLSSLQVLRLFWSFPMDLGLMEDLLIFKGLKELSLNVEEDAVLQRLLSDNQLASCIRRLHLNGFTITNGGISLLNSASSIRELSISGCNFPKITTDRRRALHFSNIEQCPQFRNMHTVQLHGCKGVRSLTWLLLAPNLDNLRVYECPQIEEIISKDKSMTQQLGVGDNSEQPFLNLTSLILEGLPDLKSIYWTPLTFPVLKSIQISRCPKLGRRPV